MGNRKLKIHEIGQQRLLVEMATQYSNPLHALREYVTNAIDILSLSSHQGLVQVSLDSGNRNVIVSDNGYGMSIEKVESLPDNIGNSDKYNQPDQRGEKAVGLLAFGSMGHKVHLITRQKGDPQYSYLRLELSGKEGNRKMDANIELISEIQVNDLFYGGFKHGTRVVVNTGNDIFSSDFKQRNVRDFLQTTYAPLLFREGIQFYLGNIGSLERLAAPDFEGEDLWEDVQVFKGSKGDEHKIDIYLVFDKDSAGENVGLFSKDVLVYKRVRELSEHLVALPFWNCDKVMGYINEPNLSLTLGREGVNRNSNAYRSLVNVLTQLNDVLWPVIEDKIRKSTINKGEGALKKLWGYVEQALLLDPISRPVVIPPKEETEKPHEPKRENNGNGRGHHKGHFAPPLIKDLGERQRDVMSTLDYTLGRPRPVINSGCQEYEENVGEDKRSSKAVEYMLRVITGPIAVEQTRRASENRKIVLEDNIAFGLEVSRRQQKLVLNTEGLMKGAKK